MKLSQLPILSFIIRYVRAYKVKSSLIALAMVVLLGMVGQTALQQTDVESAVDRTPRVDLLVEYWYCSFDHFGSHGLFFR